MENTELADSHLCDSLLGKGEKEIKNSIYSDGLQM